MSVGLVWLAVVHTVLHMSDGRVFDEPPPPVHSVMTEAGANVSLACPGVSEHSLVHVLEWRVGSTRLLEFMGAGTTVWVHRHRLSLAPDTFSLQLAPVAADDSGDYSCLVNNRPRPEAVVRLIVQDVPKPAGRPLILSYTSRAVNLSWAPSPDTHHSPVTHYIIHVRMGEDGAWDTSSDIVTPGNGTTYTVTGLVPFSVYSFRVVAVNGMGPSLPSKESYYMVTLREVPDGKPTITTAHNTSSTSLHISWRPPPRDTVHGEFLGYRIEYRPRDRGPESVKEIYVRDANVDSHSIQNLETYTQYRVSLQVFNPEGHGPSTTVLVMTDEGVPSKPLNVTVLRATSSTMDLTWRPPQHPNGQIKGYRIFFVYSNITDVRTVHNSNNPVLEYILTNLKPYTEYKISLNAFTQHHEGEHSDPIFHKTDIKGPSAPRIVNLTCQSNDTLYVQWQRPSEFYNSIDYYYIRYRIENTQDSEELVIDTSKDYVDSSTTIPNLTKSAVYEITVRAASHSIFDKKELIDGDVSESYKVQVRPDCDKIQMLNQSSSRELNAGVIAGVVCAVMSLLLAVTVFILWRKCFRAAYYYLDYLPQAPPPPLLDWDGDMKTAIPVHLFPKHVSELHADGDIGFSKEYEAIQAGSTQEEYTSEHSLHADNKPKNRYLNILAYDHSRVQLLPIPGQKKSLDYVNANYIDGFQRSRAYIGTQGPLPATFDCFWRMVWEQRVAIIVMITNLVERGRRKCDQYWPKEGIETYGMIQVRLVEEDVLATYTVRTLQIRHLRIKKRHSNAERLVYQYHYTNWPDHGTPDHPLAVLSFVKKSSAANPSDAGPIIVHCSAGVGRTGTYIVLDAMLKQITSKGEVNIFGFLRHIRTQRNFLVQTEEQYIFIHDALVEAIESGETNISQTVLSQYIYNLQAVDSIDKKVEATRLIDVHFKHVTSFQAKDFNLVSANKTCNIVKNRSKEILPVESARVHLTPKPGIDGSDYINATWFQGFHKLREFIITQHPVQDNVQDFWQMVWDHNARAVVLLSSVDDQDYTAFWPGDQEDVEAEHFRVKCIEEEDHSVYLTRDLSLHSLQDDYELVVRIFQQANWPHCCSSLVNIFDLINIVERWHMPHQNSPIIVVDRFGGTEAATFCCLTTLSKQLKYENHIDVYLYAKVYHNKRPGIWAKQDHYLYLYKAMEAACNNTISAVSTPQPAPPDLYVTANGHINGFVGNGNGNVCISPDELEIVIGSQESPA